MLGLELLHLVRDEAELHGGGQNVVLEVVPRLLQFDDRLEVLAVTLLGGLELLDHLGGLDEVREGDGVSGEGRGLVHLDPGGDGLLFVGFSVDEAHDGVVDDLLRDGADDLGFLEPATSVATSIDELE